MLFKTSVLNYVALFACDLIFFAMLIVLPVVIRLFGKRFYINSLVHCIAIVVVTL